MVPGELNRLGMASSAIQVLEDTTRPPDCRRSMGARQPPSSTLVYFASLNTHAFWSMSLINAKIP